jgi:hypothetical protein
VRGGQAPLESSVHERRSEVEGKRKRSIELKKLLRREVTDVVGENRLRKTDKLITVNAAVVLQSLIDTDRDLAVKAVSAGIDRSTDNAGEVGLQQKLPAHDDENSGSLGIERRRVFDAVEITPPHGMTW